MVLTESNPTLSKNRRSRLPTDVIVRTLWLGRRAVLIGGLLFALLGVVVALLIKPEFRSEARLMPELNSGSGDVLKRLASVAGFAGIDFSDAEREDAIRPDLYPTVLQSTPFVLYLIDQPITTTDGQGQTVGAFLHPNDTGWSFNRFFSFNPAGKVGLKPISKPDGTVRLSVLQQELVEEISERVAARFDTRSGIITITASMPDANVAAAVAQLSMKYLTQYVRNYRTGKARQDLRFYDRQQADAHKRYMNAQLALFHYDDQHKHVVMLATTMDRQQMETELSIAQTVYTELARQFEQAKLNVQARTPVFTVLEPPKVPLKRTSPRRTLVVLVFAMAGLTISGLYMLAQQVDVVEKWRTILDAEQTK
ncbi:GumC domain-containing protein [Spirosoma pollinicola]|uniref:Lipopolysaccharide biosynthesis protein n=1 Tax=Spirosoma pollinicola TaxID=2057025 RepID=A0A2K8Z6Q8_9BACT|nr:lipopolysaccharide biosynthesis protein [Spirosoma pollinicola]AUD05550.1 lipopolysaccharide biosynthesis protein [Spirosoma pollinicola]